MFPGFLLVGFTVLTTFVSVVKYLISGYRGGKIDMLVMRNRRISLPSFLLSYHSKQFGLNSLTALRHPYRATSTARLVRSQPWC